MSLEQMKVPLFDNQNATWEKIAIKITENYLLSD